MKFFYPFIALFLLNFSGFSQQSDLALYQKVMTELPKNESIKLNSINELYEQADNLMQESDKMLQNIDRINVKFPYADKKEKKEYLKKLKKLEIKSTENIVLASETYSQADNLLYSVFKKNIYTVKNKKDNERTILAVLLEKEALAHHKASTALNQLLENKERSKEHIFKIIVEIRQLETLAINKLASVYGLYLLWSDVLNKYNDKLQRVDNTDLKFSSHNINSDSLDLNKDKILFSIQIYSQKDVLSVKELNELQTKFSKIQIIVEESWIAYSVNEFSNYLEAASKKESKEAFVVAFKNGVKIDIDQAILLQITK